MSDPFKFDKDLYWKRKKQGLHGTVHPPGSKEQKYDMRVIAKKQMRDLVKKGTNERKKRKSP